MKKLLALVLVAFCASGAFAQIEDNMIGVFFSNDMGMINEAIEAGGVHPATNHVNAFAPFMAYIVVVSPTVETLGAYECAINAEGPFFLGVEGPNGWTNFGSPNNHLVGFQTPLPAADGAVVCNINMLYTGVDVVNVVMGPSEPSSLGGVPAIADGANPDNLIGCTLTCHADFIDDAGFGVVATINGEGIVATEAISLSNVKALFN